MTLAINRRLLVKIAVIAVVVTTAVSLFAWWQHRNSPETRFQNAFINAMGVRTLRQTYIDEKGEQDKGGEYSKLVLQSDFSDIKNPKTTTAVTMKLGGIERQGELVSVGNATYYRLNSASAATAQADQDNPEALYQEVLAEELKDTWVTNGSPYDGPLLGNLLFMVPIDLGVHLNTAQGQAVFGNIPEPLREEIGELYKTESPYAIKSSERVTENGRELIKYQVQLNLARLNAINSKVATFTSSPLKSNYMPDGQQATVYVDAGQELPQRIEYSAKDGSRHSVTFDAFNQPVNVAAPAKSQPYNGAQILESLQYL